MPDLDATRKLYEERGFSRNIGFGQRPALLVIDMIQAFTDPSSPLGSNLDSVVAGIQLLLEQARAKKVPVIFTTVAYDEGEWQSARFFMIKAPALKTLKAGTAAVAVDARLERRPTEPVLLKQFASAFFGTSLVALLTAARCDTVLVTGCTTSGCVRASVVDALQYGYRPIVPVEAVGDRAPEPHAANLFDMQAKYGDVVSLDATLHYLKSLPSSSSPYY